ncbi:MAG: VWA domain-containing protein [Planctomycetota bacterium]|nr:VWA domain-containing protein [Planctomycetota bacterium]
MTFESPEWLAWLWTTPFLFAAAILHFARCRSALRRFIEHPLTAQMAPNASPAARLARTLLLLAAFALALVALARPQWGESQQQLQRKGRDVCFLIDVSRSMLAEDLVPNRLERAKLWVGDVLAAAQGDRVAIVAFAGTAVVKCPLTLDYGFARLALDDTTPESVPRGGTLIGDAIRLVLDEVFADDAARYKDLILITDGEDHESFPVKAAEAAREKGVRIIAIGLGDENQGKPIVIRDPRTGRPEPIRYKGEIVMSRLDADTLRQLAAASEGGVYFNVATGTIELDGVYKRLIRQSEQRELEGVERRRLQDRFQIFLALSLALAGLAGLVPVRRRA